MGRKSAQAASVETPTGVSTHIKIVNNGPYALVLRTPNLGAVELEVGATQVPIDKFRAALSNPKSKLLLLAQCSLHPEQEPGTLTAEDLADLPRGPSLPIQALTLPAAQDAVNKCTDVATLKRWRLLDARPEVAKMLHLRWRDLVPETEGGLGKVEVM